MSSLNAPLQAIDLAECLIQVQSSTWHIRRVTLIVLHRLTLKSLLASLDPNLAMPIVHAVHFPIVL